MSIKKQVEELLKTGWFSNYQLQQRFKSSSADREARYIRQAPPEGFEFQQRKKEGSPRRCFEYSLVRLA